LQRSASTTAPPRSPRIRVQNENTKPVLSREKIFRELSSNMERNSIAKIMGLQTPSAKFALHFFVL
jgi:hypothetical protein